MVSSSSVREAVGAAVDDDDVGGAASSSCVVSIAAAAAAADELSLASVTGCVALPAFGAAAVRVAFF